MDIPDNGPVDRGVIDLEAARLKRREMADQSLSERLLNKPGAQSDAASRGQAISLEPALREAVSQVNDAMAQQHRAQFRFEMVRELDTPVLRIVDTQTNEVIRQIPSEESLQRMRAMKQRLAEAQNTYELGVNAKHAARTGVLLNETT